MAGGLRLDRIDHPRAAEDYDDQIKALQYQLTQLLIAYRQQRKSAVILLEGWDAAGKGGLIKRLTAELDPRYFEVVPIAAPNETELREHYLTRFWKALPLVGNWTIFDRSWYGRVTVERVEGFATKAEWGRAYDELNVMEELQHANGTRIIKLFLHISQEEQDGRLLDRMEQPWKRWKVNEEDFRNRSHRSDYIKAYEEMFERTNTKNAPWHVIGANHKRHARLEGLRILVDRLAEGVELKPPPLDPNLKKLAEQALGRKVTVR